MSYLIIGLAGPTLSSLERKWLAHDAVGGAIMFSRNFQDPGQLRGLVEEVRSCCPDALLMIDQEGGRVQRFGPPLSLLPPLGAVGQVYDRDRARALDLARVHGELMAAEVLGLGVDLSLAPVLDLAAGSEVIGDRAFHADPQAVAALASAYRAGMRKAGMAACGKHFPGHGTVLPDTHVADAVDPRSLDELLASDLVPFVAAIADGIEALMLAHVTYPGVSDKPAGFSRRWIDQVLRRQLAFDGAVISDDLGMRAAHSAGDFPQRITASLAAGCDLLLVCRPDDVARVMGGKPPAWDVNLDRISRLRGATGDPGWPSYAGCERRLQIREELKCLT